MTKRKRKTWTFQPDDDVLELAHALFGEKMSRGDRTRLVNEAIRLSHPADSLIAARVAAAQREVDEAKERMERMRQMLSKIKSLSSNGKSALPSAVELKLQGEHKSAQSNPPKPRPSRKSHQEKAP